MSRLCRLSLSLALSAMVLLALLLPAGEAPAITPGREALPPSRQEPLRLPLPRLRREATPQAQPTANRIPHRTDRATAALETAA